MSENSAGHAGVARPLHVVDVEADVVDVGVARVVVGQVAHVEVATGGVPLEGEALS